MDVIKNKKQESDPYESYEAFVRENSKNSQKSKNSFSFPKKEKKKKRKIFWQTLLIIAIFLVLLFGGFFLFKIGVFGKKIGFQEESSSVIKNVGSFISSFAPGKNSELRGENEGRINVLLLGRAGEGKPGANLTDTIIILSISTKEKKIALLSLPRDFYANIPKTSYWTKINSIYQYGINNKMDIDPMKKTVEEITGIPIHYFVILNFEGFKKVIDDIGGINVFVERDIYDPKYPGPNYSYELFEIKKGLHLMNGEVALKYVRERHDDPDGDFGRAKRQQQVMQSTKNKMFSAKTFLNPLILNNILNDLGNNIKTDISLSEIENFIDLGKKLDTENIINVVIDAWKKDSILKVSHVFSGSTRFFVLVPRVGNYSEINELSENIFNLDIIRRRKAEIEKENASITIVNLSKNKSLESKVRELITNKMGIKNTKIDYSYSSKKSEKSFVLDNSGGEKIFTLDEIIKKLGIELGKNQSDDTINRKESDLVLVLGEDLKNIESFDEGDIEEYKKSEEKQEYFELIKK